eukprot:Skav231110  [mRNA]  locus=scaffold2605:8230:9288:+ [translate_table: standard]
MAIWYIGVVGLKLCWTVFFDDYTLLSRSCTSKSASLSAESLFQLLGVDFAREGSKAVEFGTRVKTLGVMLDLAPTSAGLEEFGRFMTIGHTESRISELTASIDQILAAGKMSGKEGERLRGRLQWFESFASGRTAQRALRVVSNMASTLRTDFDLTAREREALTFLRNRILTAPPVKIHTMSLDTWIIFTDGSCEGEQAKHGGVGGVLIDPSGFPLRFFSGEVPTYIMDILLKHSKHPIFEIELIPILISLMLWGPFFSGRHVVFYTDNEAAKGALIRGSTDSLLGQFFLDRFVDEELNRQLKVWFARVPTASNPADEPSRFEIEGLISKGSKRNEIPWPQLKDSMEQVGER